MDIKIVASDLDGTLLRSDLSVGEKNFSAIENMHKAGVLFVPTTGRALDEMPDDIKNSPFIRYIITSNGAAICDKATGKTNCIYLEQNTVEEIFKVIDKYTAMPFTHTDGKVFIEEKNQSEEAFDYYGAGKEYKEIVLKVSNSTQNLKQFIAENPTEMLVIFFKYPEEREKCFEELNQIEGITATSSIGNNIEVIGSSVSKGEALKRLSDVTKTDIKQIMAVGDNHNDISFTKVGAFSLATANAVDAMKEAADKVICSNNESVADFIYINFIKK